MRFAGVLSAIRAAPPVTRNSRVAGGLRLLVLAALIITGLISPAVAADQATIDVENQENFGRMVIEFPDRTLMPRHSIDSRNGVLVIEFQTETEVDVSRVPALLDRYVTIARADPDGRGVRFALGRSIRVNTMEAGSKLFIDFLPPSWTGPTPRLPDEVIEELARKADQATRAAREAEALRAVGAKNIRLDVKVAHAPTLGRFVFKWNVPFEAVFARRESGISVEFNRLAKVDLSQVLADLPPFVDDIVAEPSGDGGLVVSLTVNPEADVRAFQEENTYVIDVQAPISPETMSEIDRSLHGAIGSDVMMPEGATQRIVSPGAPPPTAADVSSRAAAPDSSEPAPVLPRPAPAAPPAGQPVIAAAAPDIAAVPAAPVGAAPPDVAAELPADASIAIAPDPAAGVDPIRSVDAQSEPVALVGSPEGSDEYGSRILDDDVIRVEAKRIGRATRVVFPYRRSIGSAMFQRGPALWVVFDDPSPIETAPLQDALAGFARAIELRRVGDAQAVRIEMAEPLLATLNPDNTYWVVTIGDMVIEPTRPLPIRRSISDEGSIALDIPFGPVASVHSINDPAVGDRIMVVTGEGQPRGLIKSQSFSEVEALASAHGLAFVPRVDDLLLNAKDQLVTLSRPGGLALSTSVTPNRAAVLDLPDVLRGGEDGRAGHIDFGGTEAADPPAYWERRKELTIRVTQAQSGEEATERWYDIAEFYLGNSLGAEAKGVLDLISSLNPEEAESDRMAIMKAGAAVLLNRPEEALAILEEPTFLESPDAAVWRAIALSDNGDFATAHKNFPRAEGVIGAFPSGIQKKYLMAGVRTSIELNDYGGARSFLSQIDGTTLTDRERRELDLLNGRAIDANGHAAEAVDLFSDVVRNAKGRTAAEATYRLVRLQHREGLITLGQAIDRLEQLAVSWRGDEVELSTLRSLGQMVIENGNYRRAFEIMRTALTIDPQSDTTRLMQEDMQAAFASLFLDGKADKMTPVEALALYYDFRELTPVGRRGDAMVRKLADRLVEVDLLDQAGELLTYQVENRLSGAARAQVAADLALVQMLARRPERALLTLSRTRQAELPVAIERQRRTVEAMALSETGKTDLALDLIGPLTGEDINRLRADILWEAERYLAAGEQFERLLGNRWNDELPLSDGEQLDVLRAAISFALVDDELSVDRLRTKFSGKMSLTPNGSAFEAVTRPLTATGAEFTEVVRSIASIDVLQHFLNDYRARYIGSAGDRPVITESSPVSSLDEVAAAPTAG